MTENSFSHILEKFVPWAQAQPEILAAIVVGSQARRDHRADHWSDLDLVVYTTRPEKFIDDTQWPMEFGEVWAQAVDHTPRGDPELFIFFAGGHKVDILFVNTASVDGDDLALWVLHPDFSEVYSRGIRSLVDKSDSHGSLPEIRSQSAAHLPSQAEMTDLVNRFFLSAVRAARLIYRNDLWRGRQATDEEMKLHLLRMIEWHALSIYGPEHDVWYDGRFLSEWAVPEVAARLPTSFGHFERGSLETAFKNTLDLFEDLGQETCRNLGLEYPDPIARHVRAWLSENLNLTK